MHSLRWKLTVAFLATSFVGLVFVSVFARQLTIVEFDRLRLEQSRDQFTARVKSYYRTHGSWEAADDFFRQTDPRLPPGGNGSVPVESDVPPKPPPFLLVDQSGIAVTNGAQHRPGDRITAELIERGTPVELDGELIGTLITLADSPELGSRELDYLIRTNQALLYATIVAAVVATVIGIALARMLTRPLRELTHAIHNINRGQLAQRVPVRSQDEIGELVQAFNQMSADLAHANQLRRQMTADIAHDLRTPLTVVTGYLEGLRDGTLLPNSERFDVMYSEALQLQRLVEDLRTLSLADAGELSLLLESISPSQLLQETMLAYQPLVEQNGVTLAVDAMPELANITIDRSRMSQVLGNLISNAIRYTPEGGRITLRAAQRDSFMTLMVQDTGEGIPSDKLPYIFHRFYQVDESRHKQDSQTGLGLAIAKSIVEAHGGTLAAESVVGRGTTLVITLPRPAPG